LEEQPAGKMVRRCGKYDELIGAYLDKIQQLLGDSHFDICASTNPHQEVFIAVDDNDSTKRYAIQADGLNHDYLPGTMPQVRRLGLINKYVPCRLGFSF
jgi:hypothetical protein